MPTRPTILRMDDPGASTKQFEQYAKLNFFGHSLPTPKVLQVGPLKRVQLWRGWGPYPELSASQWGELLQLLRVYKAKMTVAVTACWVTRDATLIPFDEKWPEQAEILRGAVEEGLIEIANHGLTHCVVEGGHFLPRWYKSNRRYHREFWQEVSGAVQHQHLQRSQEILERSFGTRPVTFVPPGNVWTQDTERAAAAVGLQYLTSHQSLAPTGKSRNGLIFIGEEDTIAFHDREIALFGTKWLHRVLQNNKSAYQTVAQAGATLTSPAIRPIFFAHKDSQVRSNLGVYIRSVGERTKKLCFDAVARAVPVEHIHVIDHVYPATRTYEHMFTDALKKKYRWFVGLDADVVLRPGWLALVEAQIKALTGHNWYVISFSVWDPFRETISRGNHFYNGAYAGRSLRILQHNRASLRPESTLRHFINAQSPYLEHEWIGYHGYDQYYRDIFYQFWIRALRDQTLRRPNPPLPIVAGDNESFDFMIAAAGWHAGLLPYTQQLRHTFFRSMSSMLPQSKSERHSLFTSHFPELAEKAPIVLDLDSWYATVSGLPVPL